MIKCEKCYWNTNRCVIKPAIDNFELNVKDYLDMLPNGVSVGINCYHFRANLVESCYVNGMDSHEGK